MSMTCNPRNNDTHPSSIIRFFKIITPTNLQDGNIRIPNTFTKIHSGNMSNPMFLKTPDDKEWEIHLTKEDGNIWIQKGFKEFATHYSLDYGHMVVFQYEKTSHFKVHIFDKSTLEIEYHAYDGNQQHHQHNSPIEIFYEQLPSKKTRIKSEISSPQPYKKLRFDTSEDVGTSSKLHNLPKLVQVKGRMATQRNSPQASPCSFKNSEAKKEANQFTSTLENPNFTIKLKSNHWDVYRPRIQNSFARKYLCLKKIIKLRFDEELWTVNLACYPSEPAIKLSEGWSQFVKENELQVGDVCVFELVNEEDVVFDVHVFRGRN